MRHIEPIGEYVLEQRRIRFPCAAPWPLPGTSVVVVCKQDVHGLVVSVDDIEENGCLSGTLVGVAQGKGLTKIRPMRGYD